MHRIYSHKYTFGFIVALLPVKYKKKSFIFTIFWKIKLQFLHYKAKTVRYASNAAHRRYPDSQLSPGDLTTHGRNCLVLLHSCPDTVHRLPSRKTQTSTSLIRGCPTDRHPRHTITPTVADCRYRAPLSPRLHGNSKYTNF